MMNSGTFKVTTPSDLEIAMTRVFNAPRRLVFDALTKPELVKQWLLGRRAGPCRSARLICGWAAPIGTFGVRTREKKWGWGRLPGDRAT